MFQPVIYNYISWWISFISAISHNIWRKYLFNMHLIINYTNLIRNSTEKTPCVVGPLVPELIVIFSGCHWKEKWNKMFNYNYNMHSILICTKSYQGWRFSWIKLFFRKIRSCIWRKRWVIDRPIWPALMFMLRKVPSTIKMSGSFDIRIAINLS